MNHEHIIGDDCVLAERNVPRGVIHVEPNACLEPLTLPVDQGNQRNRYAEGLRRQFGEAVEKRLCWSIQNLQPVEGG